MPRQRLPRLCSNLKCQVVETPLWRRGWKKSDGTFARLCNSCGLHFRKGHYCEHCLQLYKEQDEFDDSWLCCSGCSRYSHIDCIKAARGSEHVADPKKYLCTDCSAPSSKRCCEPASAVDECVVDSENESASPMIIRKRKISVTTIEVRSSPAKRTRSKQSSENANKKAKVSTVPDIKVEEPVKQFPLLSDCNYAPLSKCTTTVLVERRMSISQPTADLPAMKDSSLAGFNVLWAVCEAELSKLGSIASRT